ncbi:hypothetical protein OPR90_27260 [Pseudomonas aeruginosa]|nr:hypothetical protein OPR90_27260 [Pseudomonas aeruginosa]
MATPSSPPALGSVPGGVIPVELAAGAEVSSWWSGSSGTTQLAAGAEVSSWWSGSSGTTQLATGAEVGSW